MNKPYYDDDDEKVENPAMRKFKEFECPGCNANNPCDPPLANGQEVLCNYCGVEYKATVTDEGKLKLRET